MEKNKLIKNLKKASKELEKPYEERRIEDIDDIASYYLVYCAEIIKTFAPNQLPPYKGKQ